VPYVLAPLGVVERRGRCAMRHTHEPRSAPAVLRSQFLNLIAHRELFGDKCGAGALCVQPSGKSRPRRRQQRNHHQRNAIEGEAITHWACVAPCDVMAKKRTSTKRDLVKSRTGKSFAKRTGKGRFTDMDGVKRSLASDRRKKASGRSSPATEIKATGDRPRPTRHPPQSLRGDRLY